MRMTYPDSLVVKHSVVKWKHKAAWNITYSPCSRFKYNVTLIYVEDKYNLGIERWSKETVLSYETFFQRSVHRTLVRDLWIKTKETIKNKQWEYFDFSHRITSTPVFKRTLFIWGDDINNRIKSLRILGGVSQPDGFGFYQERRN